MPFSRVKFYASQHDEDAVQQGPEAALARAVELSQLLEAANLSFSADNAEGQRRLRLLTLRIRWLMRYYVRAMQHRAASMDSATVRALQASIASATATLRESGTTSAAILVPLADTETALGMLGQFKLTSATKPPLSASEAFPSQGYDGPSVDYTIYQKPSLKYPSSPIPPGEPVPIGWSRYPQSWGQAEIQAYLASFGPQPSSSSSGSATQQVANAAPPGSVGRIETAADHTLNAAAQEILVLAKRGDPEAVAFVNAIPSDPADYHDPTAWDSVEIIDGAVADPQKLQTLRDLGYRPSSIQDWVESTNVDRYFSVNAVLANALFLGLMQRILGERITVLSAQIAENQRIANSVTSQTFTTTTITIDHRRITGGYGAGTSAIRAKQAAEAALNNSIVSLTNTMEALATVSAAIKASETFTEGTTNEFENLIYSQLLGAPAPTSFKTEDLLMDGGGALLGLLPFGFIGRFLNLQRKLRHLEKALDVIRASRAGGKLFGAASYLRQALTDVKNTLAGAIQSFKGNLSPTTVQNLQRLQAAADKLAQATGFVLDFPSAVAGNLGSVHAASKVDNLGDLQKVDNLPGSGQPSKVPKAGSPQGTTPGPSNNQTGLPQGTKGANQIPGGSLASHEQAGGHLIDRHVGKSDTYLLDRLQSNPNMKAASTFNDIDEAEAAVSFVMRHRSSEIAAWLADSSADKKKAFSMPYTYVGRVMLQGSTDTVRGTSVVVVLKKDANLPNRYFILTGHPGK